MIISLNNKKKAMKVCWCKLILSLLIIVFVWWWTPTWANWGITIAAAIIALSSLFGFCCCGKSCDMKKDKPAVAGE